MSNGITEPDILQALGVAIVEARQKADAMERAGAEQARRADENLEALKAAKQRELELLAVIEKQKALLDLASGSLGAFCADMGWGMSDMCTMDAIDSYLVNNTEPSQALREHEAKVLDDARNACMKHTDSISEETARKSPEYYHGHHQGILRCAASLHLMAEERRKK